MLRLNASRLSQDDLRHAVSSQCSKFGHVSRVRVSVADGCAVAMVSMSKAAETSKLLDSLGETMVGEAVFIWIE
jgi:hypothetical protein